MSRCTHLALLLLVACEQATPAQHPPVFPESTPPPVSVPVQAPAPEPAPVAEVAPAPAIAPVKPKPIRKAQPTTPPATTAKQGLVLPWKPTSCDPRSRLGCRWQRETDERELPRVTKKAPIVDTAEQP